MNDAGFSTRDVPVNHEAASVYTHARATGLGYGGVEGLSHRVATGPMQLHRKLHQRLTRLGQAVFVFYDVVAELLREGDPMVRGYLDYQVPSRISRGMGAASMRICRPDIVLVKAPVRDGDSEAVELLRPVITELESAPGGLGFLTQQEQARQFRSLSAVSSMRDCLRPGHRLRIVLTHQWGEYLWDLSVLCKALRDAGIDAQIHVDLPLEEFAAYVRQHWNLPPSADQTYSSGGRWNPDVLDRMRKYGFDTFFDGSEKPPSFADNTTVFRFGYADNFRSDWWEAMLSWEEVGIEFLNPPHHWLENKALMALIQLRPIRERIRALPNTGAQVLRLLDESIAPTSLLGYPSLGESLRDQHKLVTKFAGYDGDNAAWGARSVEFGAEMTGATWSTCLQERVDLPFPSIVQKLADSALFPAEYVEEDGSIKVLEDLRFRITPFFMRGTPDRETETLRQGWSDCTFYTARSSLAVHSSTDAVHGPVVFSRDGKR